MDKETAIASIADALQGGEYRDWALHVLATELHAGGFSQRDIDTVLQHLLVAPETWNKSALARGVYAMLASGYALQLGVTEPNDFLLTALLCADMPTDP